MSPTIQFLNFFKFQWACCGFTSLSILFFLTRTSKISTKRHFRRHKIHEITKFNSHPHPYLMLLYVSSLCLFALCCYLHHLILTVRSKSATHVCIYGNVRQLHVHNSMCQCYCCHRVSYRKPMRALSLRQCNAHYNNFSWECIYGLDISMGYAF